MKTAEQLVQELSILEAEHRETEEALRQCRAELEVCYKDLNTFARTLSRDLRGTLGLMISFAQVLQEYHAALADDKVRRYLDTIAQKGHRMLGVIDDLLEIETGPPPDQEVDIGPLDMASVVVNALEMVNYLVQERDARIILPPKDAWPTVLGYAPWVEEVWFNYLSNALQYGGDPPRVELGATEQADGSVRFWVRDNGDGLSSEEQARLLPPLLRPDRSPARGYGLGLVIARRIVEKLGGEFGFESEGVSGRGSLFYFTLPLAES